MLAEMVMERTYDELCEDSRIAVGDSDAAAWRIGDNALEVKRRWSEHTVADYAREIGRPKGTVYEATQMSEYWDPSARAELAEMCPNVTRSHMRKVLPFKDKSKGRWLVEKCSERGWTVDQFGYILKRYKRMTGIGRPAAPSVERAEFEVIFSDAGEGYAIFRMPEIAKFCETLNAHRARLVLVATWEV